MSLEINLKGKRALVTGVTSGIGLGVAEVLARAGCDCVGCGRSEPESKGAQAFSDAVTGAGCRAHYFRCDVTDASQIARLADQAITTLGGLDLVVSNAGLNVFRGASDCSEEDWARNIDLNLASHWRLAKAVRPALEKADPGVFLVMTSNHAFHTIPGCFPYNVTKTALLGLVRALCIEWGPQIRVVGVAPGFIETDGNQQWFDTFSDTAEERRRTEALHPVGRIGTPEEVGALCAFLASPMAGFISGSTVEMDGGRSALMQDGHP